MISQRWIEKTRATLEITKPGPERDALVDELAAAEKANAAARAKHLRHHDKHLRSREGRFLADADWRLQNKKNAPRTRTGTGHPHCATACFFVCVKLVLVYKSRLLFFARLVDQNLRAGHMPYAPMHRT